MSESNKQYQGLGQSFSQLNLSNAEEPSRGQEKVKRTMAGHGWNKPVDVQEPSTLDPCRQNQVFTIELNGEPVEQIDLEKYFKSLGEQPDRSSAPIASPDDQEQINIDKYYQDFGDQSDQSPVLPAKADDQESRRSKRGKVLGLFGKSKP